MKRLTLEREAGFTRAVLQLAALHGWRSAHFRPAMTKSGRWVTAVQGDGVGFPDLVLVRGCRLIVAELKSANGKYGPGQEDWLAAFRGVPGVEVYLWKPADWSELCELLK